MADDAMHAKDDQNVTAGRAEKTAHQLPCHRNAAATVERTRSTVLMLTPAASAIAHAAIFEGFQNTSRVGKNHQLSSLPEKVETGRKS
jgi:hypothetical protein